MKNELGRKITSLTLMTIMLAGGMVIAAPSMVPEAMAANATLFVSAENEKFGNTFGGAQIVEVVVADPAINRIDQNHGAPVVKVNGNNLQMAQGSDGAWYAYIADKTMTGNADGTGFEFDTLYTQAESASLIGKALSQTQGYYASPSYTATAKVDSSVNSPMVVGDIENIIKGDSASWSTGTVTIRGGVSGAYATATFTDSASDGFTLIGELTALSVKKGTFLSSEQLYLTQVASTNVLGNVINSPVPLNEVAAGNLGTGGAVDAGGIGLFQDAWPFVQLYNFNQTGNVTVEYQKAGTDEVTTLVFDTTDGVEYVDIDRTIVPKGAEVHVDIGDPMLNIDPTSADTWFFDHSTGNAHYATTGATTPNLGNLMFDGNGSYKMTLNGNLETDTTWLNTNPTSSQFAVTESGSNTSVFTSYDDNDDSTINVSTSATIDTVSKFHETSILIANTDGTIVLDEASVGDEWNAGEEITVTLTDADQNLNTRADEDLDLNSSSITRIPALTIGSPLSMTGSTETILTGVTASDSSTAASDTYSKIARVITTAASTSGTSTLVTIDTGILVSDLESLQAAGSFRLLNVDIRSLIGSTVTVSDTDVVVADAVTGGNTIYTTIDTADDDGQFLIDLADGTYSADGTDANNVFLRITVTHSSGVMTAAGTYPIVADFFSFGPAVNNAIYRMELEETGDNTDTFEGLIQYTMANNTNNVIGTYTGLVPISNEIEIFLETNYTTDVGAPRVNYLDLDALDASTQISDQQQAPTHSGVISLDAENYKTGDTVTITVEDMDLNADGTLIDVHTAVAADYDGTTSDPSLFNVIFNTTESSSGNANLVETGIDTGIFVATFAVPSGQTGNDMDVNYYDFRDSSGNTNEVGDSAGIRATTGSISLDRTVYPVPWGLLSNFDAITGKAPSTQSVFPVHATGVATNLTASADLISTTAGDLTVTIAISDDDLNTSATGEDKMNTDLVAGAVNVGYGPVKITVSRGSDEVILGYAGGDTASTTQRIYSGTTSEFREFGPITETAGDSGVFEFDYTIKYTDGPSSSLCPVTASSGFTGLDGSGSTETDRFTDAAANEYCILQGDILTVQYTDSADASGNTNTVTDSATFDLRNGVLQSDKSVYIIGSDMIVTIIEPDWDLNSGSAENYILDTVEWDSSAKTTVLGSDTEFDPEPSNFRETGDSTGIFQVVIEIPSSIDSTNLERGEQIDLTYTDWGPSGANYVGAEKEDLETTVYTSNFGATVELDQKVYTWTDKVYITIVAPDHNFDSSLVDSIGETADDPIKISTRSYSVKQYKLVETSFDTGIFTGEVILTGFSHDADGNGAVRPGAATTSSTAQGPTNGTLETSSDDGLTVSFEYSDDETVVGSALIRWNIGEVQFLEASYPASGTGVVRVIDPDMNLNPEAVDNFNVDSWSDSDAGGISLTVTETNEATGIFEGTVFFTVSDASSGHRLRVSEGDTVTASYTDRTLPDPYTNADDLDVTSTTLIGTVVPPLERAPAANLRTVDAFGNSLDAVSVDQQVQLTADLSNGQDSEQAFAYLVQIQDESGITVSLAWITGSLSAGQSFSPALSWIPTEAGSYTATAFVWESVDNPTALSPSVSTTVNVR